MIIIGIDPGTACGWAVYDTEHTTWTSGVWDLKSRRHEGGGMRFLRLRGYLRELFEANSVQGRIDELELEIGSDPELIKARAILHRMDIIGRRWTTEE